MAFILFIFLYVPGVFGQEKASAQREHEFFLQLDNDAFAFTYFDRYYTNGIFFGYAHSLGLKERIKVAFSQQIYTPERYTVKDIRYYDRPYAGVLYGKVAYQYLFKQGWVEGGVLLGKIGPGSKAEEVQVWYHRVFGFPQPRGWIYQIKSGGLVNFNLESTYKLWGMKGLDIWLSGRAAIGNYDQSLMASPQFRIGNFQSHNHSYFSGSRVGGNGAKEFYFHAGANLKRVFKNATLQGTHQVSGDLVTMEPSRMQNEYFAQVVLGFPRFGFSYRFSYRTQETLSSKGQLLGSLRFSYLF